MKIFFLLLLCSYLYSEPIDYKVRIKMQSYLLEVCEANNVPINIAYRLIEWESKWNATAINFNSNGTRDYGLMQLNSEYLTYFSDKYNNGILIDVWMWRVSIKVGILYLRDLYIVTGNWPAAVASYNMGLTKYRRYVENKTNLPIKTVEMINFIFD